MSLHSLGAEIISDAVYITEELKPDESGWIPLDGVRDGERYFISRSDGSKGIVKAKVIEERIKIIPREVLFEVESGDLKVGPMRNITKLGRVG